MATALLRLGLRLIAAAGVGLLVLRVAPALAAECAVPSDFFVFEPMLPRTVAALSAGKKVTIVAIGSASTVGRAAGGPVYAWPKQLGTSLSKAFPKATISVLNLGKARQTAADMTARFAKEIIPLAPLLVIWQTGTVDAVAGVEIGEFRDTLQSGLTRLKAVSEVVLMDAQFSRPTHVMTDFEPYEDAIREVADLNDVPVFPRNDLMRYWSESGTFDYSAGRKKARRAMARRLYGCIGSALAEFISRRADAPEPHQ